MNVTFQKMYEERVKPLQNALERVMVGQKQIIRRVAMALFSVGQRDFHADGSRFLGTGHLLVEGPTGTGKCLAKGTPVLLYDGTTKNVEDVKIGDLLMGPDSQFRTVVSLNRGFGKMYKVTPVKGESYIVNDEHILSLKTTGNSKKGKYIKGGKIINIAVKDFINKSKSFKHCVKGYRTGINFSEQKVPLDPYFLGVWLGDGTSCVPEICNMDSEVVSACKEVATSFGLNFVTKLYKNDTCPNYALSGKRNHLNPITYILRSFNLLNNKHIPHEYKVNSRENRLQLLAGILDTDGSLSCNGYEFVNKNQRLAEDVVFLARSLGFAAYINKCKKKCQTGAEGEYYRVFISGDTDQIPVKILYKKASVRKQKKNVLVTSISVDPVEDAEYFGFEISGPDRLFLLGDFTVTHNSVL